MNYELEIKSQALSRWESRSISNNNMYANFATSISTSVNGKKSIQYHRVATAATAATAVAVILRATVVRIGVTCDLKLPATLCHKKQILPDRMQRISMEIAVQRFTFQKSSTHWMPVSMLIYAVVAFFRLCIFLPSPKRKAKEKQIIRNMICNCIGRMLVDGFLNEDARSAFKSKRTQNWLLF